MIRRFSAWTNRNPLLAVWIGLLICFVLMYVATPLIVRHADQTIPLRGNT